MLVASFMLATAVLATTEPTPASNLEWALAHRRAFIVGGGNDPTLGLKFVHQHGRKAPLAVPQLGSCVPPRGAPCGSGQLGTPRARPSHWAPRHCLGCSS